MVDLLLLGSLFQIGQVSGLVVFLVVLVLVDLKSLGRVISPCSSNYRGLLWN